MKRGAVQHTGSTLISVWFPKELVAKIDRLVSEEDLDRSKVIRRALRHKLNQADNPEIKEPEPA